MSNKAQVSTVEMGDKGSIAGHLGIVVERIIPPTGKMLVGRAVVRFVILDEQGMTVMQSGQAVVPVGHTASLSIRRNGKGVDGEWLRDLDLQAIDEDALFWLSAIDKKGGDRSNGHHK